MMIFVLRLTVRLTDVYSIRNVVTDDMIIQHESDSVHYVCGYPKVGARSVFKNVKMFL